MTTKADFKKTLDAYQAKPGKFRIVDVPDMRYLMIDGHGDPNTSPAYAEALRALYPVAYKLKFASKRDLRRDYVVMPLEGLWWAQDMDSFTASRDKSRWDWTVMIMAPCWIDRQMFDAAVEQAGAKGRPARLGDIRLEPLSEGRCVQTLHVGSYDDEADVLARMHDGFIPPTVFAWPASTTRSTSVTPAESLLRSCAPSSGSRSASLTAQGEPHAPLISRCDLQARSLVREERANVLAGRAAFEPFLVLGWHEDDAAQGADGCAVDVAAGEMSSVGVVGGASGLFSSELVAFDV